MGCVAVLVQALGIRFQRRSQRPASQRLDRSWVGAVIKEVVEWSIHPTSIYGNGQLRLCRVLSAGTGENHDAGEFTRHSPELGIVPKPVRVRLGYGCGLPVMTEQGTQAGGCHPVAAG